MKNIFFEEIKEIVKKPLDKTEPNLIKQNLSAEELFVLLFELSQRYNVELNQFIDAELTIGNIFNICITSAVSYTHLTLPTTPYV